MIAEVSFERRWRMRGVCFVRAITLLTGVDGCMADPVHESCSVRVYVGQKDGFAAALFCFAALEGCLGKAERFTTTDCSADLTT